MSDQGVEGARRAIAVLAAGPESEAREQLIEREMALYLKLPEAKRREVDVRLAALAAMPADVRTVADVLEAAQRMKVKRSNVYRLLKRIEELGPVGGLVPGRRARERASTKKSGFGEPFDGWIEELLRNRPDASIAEIQRMVTSRIRLLPAGQADGSSVRGPTQSALHRRINELRGRGIRAEGALEAVGASVVIDYCPLNATVFWLDGGRYAHRLAQAVLIIDTASSLILGAGIFLERNVAAGLVKALDHMAREGLPVLVREGVRLADRLERIRWIVSPDLADAAARAHGIAEDLVPPVRLDVDWGGRPGVELHRQIGNAVGPYHFHPRTPAADGSSDWEQRSSIDFEVPSLEHATGMLEFEAAIRNHDVMAVMNEVGRSRERSQPDETTERWLGTVDLLFAPVRSLAEDRESAYGWLPQGPGSVVFSGE
jgi:hypothetical protein